MQWKTELRARLKIHWASLQTAAIFSGRQECNLKYPAAYPLLAGGAGLSKTAPAERKTVISMTKDVMKSQAASKVPTQLETQYGADMSGFQGRLVFGFASLNV